MLQLSLIIRRNHPIIGAPILLVVSGCSANRAIGVDMFTSPALVALPFEWTAGLHEVVFPAVLAGAFELVQRGRRRVSLGSGAPSIIRGALGGNKSDAASGGIGGWGLAWVKEEVVDAGVHVGMEQMSFHGDFLLSSMVESSFGAGNILVLDGFLHYGGTVAANLSYDADVFKASKGIVY